MGAEAQAEPTYWSVQRLADHFGVSKSTVYRGCREDGWPHSRIGGLRFNEDDVTEIEKRVRRVSAPEPEPKYTAKQLVKAAERLGLPAPRRGS